MKSAIKIIFPPTFYYKTSFSLNPQLIELFRRQLPRYIPYGMAVITSFLRKHKYEVSQVDLNERIFTFNSQFNDRNKNRIVLSELSFISNQLSSRFPNELKNTKLDRLINQIIELLDLDRIDILGFSLLGQTGLISALLIAEKVKLRFKDIKIVFGGPPVTFFSCEYFEKYQFIDYLIVGEGEEPLLKLIKHIEGEISIEQVPNLIYRGNGRVIQNPVSYWPIEEQCVPDFGGLSLHYNSFIYNSYRVLPIPYAIAQGCRHRCNFCTNKVQKYDTKTLKKVINEIKFLKEKYHSNYFIFVSPNIDFDYLKNFCNEIINQGIRINWSADVSIFDLDRDLLYKMRQAGCRTLNIGIESGSNTILQYMNKNFTKEEAQQVLEYSSSVGIKNDINLMVGYPYESSKDIDLSIQFVKKTSKFINGIDWYPFCLRDKSPIFQNSEKNRIKILYPIDIFHSAYAYDEIDGLRWQQKTAWQELHLYKLISTILLFYMKKKSRKEGKLHLLLIYIQIEIRKLLSVFNNLLLRLKYFKSKNNDLDFNKRKRV